MNIVIDKEILEKYYILQDFYASKMRVIEYQEKYNYKRGFITNIKKRVEFKSISHPEQYRKLVEISKDYIEKKLYDRKINLKQFCKEKKVAFHLISGCITHLNWKNTIDKELEKQNLPKNLSFIEISSEAKQESQNKELDPVVIKLSKDLNQQQEVLEHQNDLEIIPCKGIKLSIAPCIGSEKLMKIIEFFRNI